MKFGTEESLGCIQDVALTGGANEPLCLAHKTTLKFFVAGIYARDDGYVLKVKGQESYYPLPRGEELAELQAEGKLPAPLPHYRISTGDYLLGYSLWWILGAIVIFSLIARRLSKARMARLEAMPLSYGPPALRTSTDRYIDAQVRPLLRAGERVQHQAYGFDRVITGMTAGFAAKGYYAVLTDQRLILINTRIGALRPILENRGVGSLERSVIHEVVRVDERTMHIRLSDGSYCTLHVVASRHLSNQDAFLASVPRLLQPVARAA